MLVKIRTEKVKRGCGKNAVRCRKILEITGCQRESELPVKYLDERGDEPVFYRNTSYRCYGSWDVDECGRYYTDPVGVIDTSDVVVVRMRFPTHVMNDISAYQWVNSRYNARGHIMIAEGEVLLEEDFQKIVKWMKKAGERLHLINSEWSGEETVTI